MNDVEDYCPHDKRDWRKWLELNHDKKEAVWLIFFKKKSPDHNLSWSEAVDEALCFGWIDSTKKTIDKERYMQYFSRRKPKSLWSKFNKEKIDKLIQNKQMSKAGFDSIETAKHNGSWTRSDDVEALLMPEELKVALENQQGSMEYFDSLSKSVKKMLLHWVISAKRQVTRQKRILEIVESASEKLKPEQFR